MKINLLLLLSVIVALSSCRIKYDAFRVQYPTQVNWPGKRAPLPLKATEPATHESLCLENSAPSAPALQASANTNDVPLATAPSPQIENTNSIKPLLEAKLQSMKAFQKLSPERRQKMIDKIDKVSAKFEARPHRVGGMPLAIASFVASMLAILSLCLTGVAPPLLIVSIFLALAAVILGSIAIRRAESRLAKAFAITGIILGAITFIVDLIVVAMVLTVLATLIII